MSSAHAFRFPRDTGIARRAPLARFAQLSLAATAPLSTAPSTLGQQPVSGRSRPVAVAAQRARCGGRRGRHRPGRSGVQRAHHLGARRDVHEPEGGHRQARRAPRAGVRRGADRRGDGGQGGRIRHPVAGARTSLNRNGMQGFGGTNFGARGTGTNIIDARDQSRHRSAGASNLGVIRGTVTIPGLGTITNLALLARALETDANANILSTPNLLTLDNEEARIIVGQNVPFITGQYAQTGTRDHGHAVPDDRAPRRRPDAARQAADHRRRHGAPEHLPGSVARRRTRPIRPASSPTSARSNRPCWSTTARSSCSAG